MSLDCLPLIFPLSLLLSFFSPPLLSPFFPPSLHIPFSHPLFSPFFFLSFSHSSAPFVIFLFSSSPPPLSSLLSPPLPLPQLAKTQFMQNQDPLDASLFYLAMKKKTLLKGLFRYVYAHSPSRALLAPALVCKYRIRGKPGRSCHMW